MTSLRTPSVRRRTANRDWVRPVTPWVSLVVLYLIAVAISPGYLQPTQIGSLLQLASILGIIALGQTLVILIGGIDLSVGAVATLANLITAMVLNGSDVDLPLAIALSVGAGALVGLANGVIITLFKIPDLIVTLAMMTVVIGAGYLLTNGAPRGSAGPMLQSFVTSGALGLLTPAVLLWFGLAVVTILALRGTVAGRRVYAVGLNRSASHASGISVDRTVIALYVLSGTTAAIAGILITGYTSSSFLGSGDTYQLASIAAVVLGGASIFGGRGGYAGTLAGAAITTLLLSILQVVGIPKAGQNIVYGLVILVMLALFTSRRVIAVR